MICTQCKTREDCNSLCEDARKELFNGRVTCVYDIGCYCAIGDPHGLYHPQCNEGICNNYNADPLIRKSIEIDRPIRELSFSCQDIDRIIHSRYNTGGVEFSDGYSRLLIPNRDTAPSEIALLFKRNIQKFLIDDPLDILTVYQCRALRLYFSLISKKQYSFSKVAERMKISKERAVKQITNALQKIQTYVIYYVVCDAMNGSLHRFERLGIRLNIGNNSTIHDEEMYNRIKAVVMKNRKLLSREQCDVLWMFCGFYGSKKYSVHEIANIMDISVSSVKERLERGMSNINKHIIDKILDNDVVETCSARDCLNVYRPVSSNHKYCCSTCRDREKERRYRDRQRVDTVKDKVICKGCGMEFIPLGKEEYHNLQCRKTKEFKVFKENFLDKICQDQNYQNQNQDQKLSQKLNKR